MSGFAGNGSTMSPLTMAMLAGGGINPMMLGNPALLAPTERMQLGQRMAAEGTDSSAAYPAQALSRLGQALIGGLMMKGGMSGLQDAMQQQQQGTLGAIQYMRGDGGDLSGGAVSAPPIAAPSPAASPAAAAPSVPRDGTQTAGMQANNPGNLMYAGQPGASGVIPVSGGRNIAAFPDMPTGVAADARQLMINQDQHGVQSVRQQVARWVSDPKANIDSYVTDAAKAIGVDPDAPVDWHNPQVQTAFLQAQFPHESAGGATTLQPADVQKGVALAGAPVGTQYAQAGNAATDAGTGAAPGTAAPAMPPTGLNSPMVARAMGMMQRAQAMMAANPYNPAIQEAGRMQIQQAQMLAGLDQVVTLPNGVQLNLRSGQQSSAAMPLPHYVTTPTGSEDTTGTHPPTFMPSPRVFQTPAGETGAVGPGSATTVISPPNNPGVAARSAAAEQGTQVGRQAAVTVDKMADIGRESDTALGNIDYGLNQLHAAQQGGINSGYFAPWLATAAAAGKSLGVDLKGLGIDPAAVGNVQSAQKTLGVVAGTILQNTIGKDSQITDAKIDHFIHTQPGIETDPQAIERIMNWARTQFVFNHNMAMDAMNNVDPQTGMLPPGWRASYFAKNKAFAPIYDPLAGEMKQPNGESPPAEAPQPGQVAGQPQQSAQTPAATPSRADIEAEMRRRGLIK
jgi:hypothetical protein